MPSFTPPNDDPEITQGMRTTKRPTGRNLKDFGNLLPAEQQLLTACARGEACEVETTQPTVAKHENKIRGHFIRFLALGGDFENPVHEEGLKISGCWISGVIDINYCQVIVPIRIRHCRIEQIVAQQARIKMLSIRNSLIYPGFKTNELTIPAIDAGGLQSSGSLFLEDNFESTGCIVLLGCSIGGDLNFRNAKLKPRLGPALLLDRVKISGSVFLDNKFIATGYIQLLGAQIGNNLSCSSAKLSGHPYSLACDGAQINGSIFPNNKFKSIGEVRIIGATIIGTLECTDGEFQSTKSYALSCHRARIVGAVAFNGSFKAIGIVSLCSASIGDLIDAKSCWPQKGMLELDGVQIARFGGSIPKTARARVEWLNLQPSTHLNNEFRTHPWEETIRIFRNAGHPEEARKLAIAKRNALRSAGSYTGVMRDVDWAWGLFASYRYSPQRLLIWMMSVWLVCALTYDIAANNQLFAPSSPIIQTNSDIISKCSPEKNSHGG